jgi:SAM-dependent methyltransferase
MMRRNARPTRFRGPPLTADQTWDPERYARHARFVSDLGMPVVELLDPQPGERILDLGCGDGALTEKLQALGCRVVGVDQSPDQVRAARDRGLDARVADGQALPFDAEFDAVFSNAALHWMKDAGAVVSSVRRALKPGGRFVAECGGRGNVRTVEAALEEALLRRGRDPAAASPWTFPDEAEYRRRLEAAGFEVRTIALFPRPTPLPGDILDWLATFAGSFASTVPGPEGDALFQEVREAVRPRLQDERGTWILDYVRLRFSARLRV